MVTDAASPLEQPEPELNAAAEAVRTLLGADRFPPGVGVVLGSGLGDFADSLQDARRLPYADIPHMPRSSVVGHAGNLVAGRTPRGGTPVLCLQGRVHRYEGHALERVVFGVRLLAQLGCGAVLLTNAAGGIADGFEPGDLMLITDHLNLMGDNPLLGPNDDRIGPRFPDMSEAYDGLICGAARGAARLCELELREGVYAGLLGPTYETPAEVRMLRTLGASAVGMSTVPEVIALRHRGVRVGAVSCVTNLAAGLGSGHLDHSDVAAVAAASHDRFVRFLDCWLELVHGLLEAGPPSTSDAT